jgi:hypothetical protein
MKRILEIFMGKVCARNSIRIRRYYREEKEGRIPSSGRALIPGFRKSRVSFSL